MKISYNWLKNYISGIPTPDETAKILTDIGLEVESFEKVETIKGGLEGVVIGEVLSCEKHPDADKLSVTTVDYGQGAVQIVCGAPNVRKGLKVVVATCGCTLYHNSSNEEFKIKKSKIRGIESNGMLCAEDEIGLGVSHAGIMELTETAYIGQPAREYFGITDDYIMEIGLTPNRVDASSHIGVARDIYAYLKSNGVNCRLTLPNTDEYPTTSTGKREVSVTVDNIEACPRYCGVTITDVKVSPSPEWLQNNLRSIGITPKNNIVDITNFILHEMGQPLHAFDADKIKGDKIIVKSCAEGTPFTTLDETERKLSDNDLMICNISEPMCIAGVFGGIESGVSDTTKNIFIESAYFNPVWVRKTAKRHGLNTDASFRYERGIDPEITVYALKRAAMLVQEIASGQISSKITDVNSLADTSFKVELSLCRVNSIIGKEIPRDKVLAILDGLGITITEDKGDILYLAVPAYRVDVQREIDVIEDILRIYGYNNIEIPQAVHSTLSYAPKPNKDKIVNTLSDFLSDNGYNEIMSNSLTKTSYYENLNKYPFEKGVKIVNPLSNDLNIMRQTLLFNAMEALELNSNRRNGNIKLYEVGNCYFFNSAKQEEGGLAPYRQEFKLSMLVSGIDVEQSWRENEVKSDFFTLKAMTDSLMRRFGIDINSGIFETSDNDIYKEGVYVKIQGKKLFEIGSVSQKIKKLFSIKADVFFMEMNLDTFIDIVKNNRLSVKELSKYPEVRRDLALMLDSTVRFSDIKNVAVKADKKLIKNISLFDVYQGNKLPEGKKSYAISCILEDTTKTLTDNIIDGIMNNMISLLEKQCGAVLRK